MGEHAAVISTHQFPLNVSTHPYRLLVVDGWASLGLSEQILVIHLLLHVIVGYI